MIARTNAPMPVDLLVERGLDRVREARLLAYGIADRAQRYRQLADIYEREGRWWGVLLRTLPIGAPATYRTAVVIAQLQAEDDAKDWRRRNEGTV